MRPICAFRRTPGVSNPPIVGMKAISSLSEGRLVAGGDEGGREGAMYEPTPWQCYRNARNEDPSGGTPQDSMMYNVCIYILVLYLVFHSSTKAIELLVLRNGTDWSTAPYRSLVTPVLGNASVLPNVKPSPESANLSRRCLLKGLPTITHRFTAHTPYFETRESG
jgi:hypothetical protein